MLNEKEIEKIKKEIEPEFPNDLALQLVHIARKIIAKKAEKKGLKFLDYIKLTTEDMKAIK